MSVGVVALALAAGVVSGVSVMRASACMAGFGFCLHALVTARWSHLAGRPPVKQASPEIVLRMLFQVAGLAALFGSLLYYGFDFIRREPGFGYGGPGVILYAAATCATALSCFPAMRRRVVFYWRMSHEFDFAQRRQRTFLLKS